AGGQGPASGSGVGGAGATLRRRRRGAGGAAAPARSLADEGPLLDRPRARSDARDALAAVDADAVDLHAEARARADGDVALLVARLLAAPALAAKDWVHEQYDDTVRGGTVLPPGAAGAGVVRLPGSRRAVSMSLVGNGRWCEVDPREGTRRVVAAAYRDVACTGARPLATTNCLNLGDPTRPDQMWELVEVVGGLGDACAALGAPVTGGNVSLYNATAGRPIPPTPVGGVVGVLDDAAQAVGRALCAPVDGAVPHAVLLLGAPTAPGLAGSELRRLLDLPVGGVLAPVDEGLERRLAGVLAEAAAAGWLTSAGSVARGGLAAALVRAAVAGGTGVRIELPEVVGVAGSHAAGRHLAQALFSESPGRALVAVPAAHVDEVLAACAAADVPVVRLGEVGGDAVALGPVVLDLDRVTTAHRTALACAMGEDA
ncbi:MAG: AIR synthase related protein, partial [Nitriliruptoraceae bacterium]